MANLKPLKPCGGCGEPFEGVGRHICARRALYADRDVEAKRPHRSLVNATGEFLAEAAKFKSTGVPRSRTTGELAGVDLLLRWMKENR
jgi:hypothetical protein